MNSYVQRELSAGVMFNSVRVDRFKTMKISANIYMPLSEKTAAVNALLCYMLVRCCKKYPDFTTLSRNCGVSPAVFR